MTFGSLPEEKDQSGGHQHQRRHQQHDVRGGEIVGQGVDTGLEHRQVRHGERRHPVEEDETVDRAADQPEKRDQGAVKDPAAKEKRGNQGDQNEQVIHQQGDGRLCDKIPEVLKSTGEGFMIKEFNDQRQPQRKQGDVEERYAFLRMPAGIRKFLWPFHRRGSFHAD